MRSDEEHELDEIAQILATIQPTDTPAVLIGWVTIAEFSDIDGRRWLVTRSGTQADSDHFTTSWQRRGYLREVLDTGWVDDPSTEEESDE